nr:DUF4917 family protein [uncultured Dongia sp.]
MAKAEVLSFTDALETIQEAQKKHLLLGNGFSIALKPDIFTYGSLLDNADFTAIPHVPALFEALKTKDFEIVIRHLQDAATVVEIYKPEMLDLAAKLRADAAAVKDALVSAIAIRHPDRPYDIADAQYAACRSFLNNFDRIYTLNYDVLLYWSIMQDSVDDLDIRHDDGFRHPEDDYDQPYVSWQEANSATVSFLHGALHLFDAGHEITKYTWSKTDKPIVEQIREALAQNKYPLFVAEGSSQSKRTRILHNAYLDKALRSFKQSCSPAKNSIVIYGHSLAENDKHILRCIAKGAASHLLVSLYGDVTSDLNQTVIRNAQKLVQLRAALRERNPLQVVFFDAATANVWG